MLILGRRIVGHLADHVLADTPKGADIVTCCGKHIKTSTTQDKIKPPWTTCTRCTSLLQSAYWTACDELERRTPTPWVSFKSWSNTTTEGTD